MLGERIAKHGVQCWLVNTGWTGGPAGVGHRMRLGHTRAMVRAALAGRLDRIATEREPGFGLEVPTRVPGGVPDEVLRPRGTWPAPVAYDAAGGRLAGRVDKEFAPCCRPAPTALRGARPRAVAR